PQAVPPLSLPVQGGAAPGGARAPPCPLERRPAAPPHGRHLRRGPVRRGARRDRRVLRRRSGPRPPAPARAARPAGPRARALAHPRAPVGRGGEPRHPQGDRARHHRAARRPGGVRRRPHQPGAQHHRHRRLPDRPGRSPPAPRRAGADRQGQPACAHRPGGPLTMANFFSDNDDLRFYFDQGIDWREIAEITERGYRDPDGHAGLEDALAFYREIAEMMGEVAAEEVAPRAAEIDRAGSRCEDGEAVMAPQLEAIFRRLADMDMHRMCVPRELGGLNCPMLLYFISTELLARADVSVMAHYGFHTGILMSMLQFSNLEGTTEVDPDTGAIRRTRWQEEIEEIAS